ncbi:MAG: UPF0280 family protein [Candidatus Omnitrophica bacterium]|jgi:hypothetical protein|nr:UPF0280 family protein [Candidatus Omnitrophota bacterium]
MKNLLFQRRFYRGWVNVKDLHEVRFVEKETDLQISTSKKLDLDFVKEKIRALRWEIEAYIEKDRRFLVALKPISVELHATAIIRDMAEAAKKANVGPMATVAGAVAKFLGEALIKNGYRDVIIENGGDLFIKTTKTRVVGIYAGRSKVWNRLGLKIKPAMTPISVCASSGTIGHSLSFGCADSVIILSKDAALADAMATATANRISSKKDFQPALDFARSVKGVLGVVIILKNNLISWGCVEFENT